MFYRVFAFLALVALAFANPRPEPQALVYTGPSVYPGSYSYYGSGVYGAAAYAPVPYAYSPYYYR